MADPRPKPLPAPDDELADAQAARRRGDDRPSDSGVEDMVLQTEILDELRRMNRMMQVLTRGPRRYTLAFFSGVVRGLGAAIGATVVFALLVGVLSRVNTIPLIGSYLAKVYDFAAKTSPTIGEMGSRMASPVPTPSAASTAIVDSTPIVVPTSSAAPSATPR